MWRVWSHDGRLPKEGTLGNRKFPSPREDPIRSRRAKAKVAKARRERRPLTSGQTVRKIHRLMRKPSTRLQVSSLELSADTRSTVNETCKLGKESRNRHEISVNPAKVETFVPML